MIIFLAKYPGKTTEKSYTTLGEFEGGKKIGNRPVCCEKRIIRNIIHEQNHIKERTQNFLHRNTLMI